MVKAADSVEKKTSRSVKRTETYNRFIFKVLKQVHKDTGINTRAMAIMNSFVHDMFDRIATEAAFLARRTRKSTVTSHEIMTAVKLILPGDLANHAISEAHRALNKYTSSSA